MSKIKTRVKGGKIVFYSGRKKATEAERKEYLKEHYRNLDFERLSKEDRQYIGRVKGGQNRAKKAARIEGKFIDLNYLKKVSGIDIEKLAELRGRKSPKELLEKDTEFAEQLAKAYTSAGISTTYKSEDLIDKVNDYTGKVLVNGVTVDKLEAIALIDEMDKYLKRKFGAFLTNMTVTYKKGGKQLLITMPTKKEIRESNDMEDLFEGRNELSDTLAIVTSPERKAKKKSISKGRRRK